MDHRQIIVQRRKVQGSEAVRVLQVQHGAVGDQQVGHVRVADVRRRHERRHALRAGQIYDRAALKQQLYGLKVAPLDGAHQRRAHRRRAPQAVHVHAHVQQLGNRSRVASRGRQVDGREPVDVERVEVGAILAQLPDYVGVPLGARQHRQRTHRSHSHRIAACLEMPLHRRRVLLFDRLDEQLINRLGHRRLRALRHDDGWRCLPVARHQHNP